MTNKHPERDHDHIRHALWCAARVGQLIAVGKDACFNNADMIDISSDATFTGLS